MATYYISPTGNDTTGNGSAGTPWKTANKAIAGMTSGDECRFEKTAAPASVAGANFTWNHKSAIINTSASLVGTIAAGDYISRDVGGGDGALDTIYRVASINATTITLNVGYWHPDEVNETDTSILKYTPDNGFCSATNLAMINLLVGNTNMTFSGGWNLSGTPTQDGSTYCTHTGAIGTATSRGMLTVTTGGGHTVEKLNFIGFNIGVNSPSPSITVRDCSIIHVRGGGVSFTGNNITLDNVCISYAEIAGAGIRFAQTANTFTTMDLQDVKVVSWEQTGTASSAIYVDNANYIVGDVTAYNHGAYAGGAFYTVSSDSGFEGMKVEGSVLYGFFSNGHNTLWKNCECDNAVIGWYQAIGPWFSLTWDNCTATNCSTAGISLRALKNTNIQNCTFVSNTIDIAVSNAVHSTYLTNNNHTTPGTRAVNLESGAGLVVVKKCTIDGASIAKSINVTAGINNYNYPQLLTVESFGLEDGAYYGPVSVTRSTTVVSPFTGHYTLKIAPSVAIANNRASASIKLGSFWVKSGESGTVSWVRRKDPGFFGGSLVPVLKLNGITKATGTAITSFVTTNWTGGSIAYTAGDIIEDGELSLELIIQSSNARTFYFADITKT